MIKSLEVVIAITLLFLFVLTIFSSYTKPTTEIENIDNKVYDILSIKAENTDFRDLVDDKNTLNVYNMLYDYIDVSYYIEICDYINTDCQTQGTVPSVTSQKNTVDYYFYDANKTLSVVVWIE